MDTRKEIKLHLGCGPVYLRGYVNIDIKGELAKNNPKLVKKNVTVLERYFKFQWVSRKLGHDKTGEIVADYIQDIISLPQFKDGSVAEILTVNVINHMSFMDFQVALKEWYRVLKPGGSIIIDVDDIDGNCKLLLKAKTRDDIEWALRYMYNHGRDRYDSHYWGYNEWYLQDIMDDFGFELEWRDDKYIYHDRDYPRFITSYKKL